MAGAVRSDPLYAPRLANENRNGHHLDMAKLSALYDEDFVRWTEEQAAALRSAISLPAGRTGSSNLPLDWENLAEEIESLGKSDRRELRSQITRVLRHLLKLDVSPAAEPRASWREIGRASCRERVYVLV